MAAYNGEEYVAEQIESILQQDCPEWRLVVRDDCSTDGTLTVAREQALRCPERVVVQERSGNSGSAKQNFLEMLSASMAPYVMFSDDDDVWLPDKISRTLGTMRELESRHSMGTPLLVHTDLTVVGKTLDVVALSMSRAQQLDGIEARLARTVVQNMATGCTVMVNRALADLVREPFDGIAMHDWWLAMIASAFGAIGFVDSPTVLYRQHGRNAVGARPSRSLSYNVGRYLDREGTRKMLADSYTQAEVFLERFPGTALRPAGGDAPRLRCDPDAREAEASAGAPEARVLEEHDRQAVRSGSLRLGVARHPRRDSSIRRGLVADDCSLAGRPPALRRPSGTHGPA